MGVGFRVERPKIWLIGCYCYNITVGTIDYDYDTGGFH